LRNNKPEKKKRKKKPGYFVLSLSQDGEEEE
jgi:hypothetical protein